MVLSPENSTPRERSENARPGAEILEMQGFEEKETRSIRPGIPLALEDRRHDDRRNGGRLLQDGPDPGRTRRPVLFLFLRGWGEGFQNPAHEFDLILVDRVAHGRID